VDRKNCIQNAPLNSTVVSPRHVINYRENDYFAKLCSSSVFNQVFLYKIVTQILPTNKYLNRYQIVDSDLCNRCLATTNTAYHNLRLCDHLALYLSTCFEFLREECNLVETITVENYLFGFSGMKTKGINHILLKLKKNMLNQS
jgi:hypothetical protein